ncbi:hypothetical protein SGGMMB4_05036 [Sodalis glossinidius str. 'morsitans']|uniref:Transposase n=1 Tax=Sodalis glossinidius (strain morsitans) TaxID=343509 RepID=A0A193QMT6_SODGM|nr:hypothetical protein SGGMMB4_05036 [Sodalis glossinidius str. 'morsitans']
MFTMNHQISPVKAKKLSKWGFTALKHLHKWLDTNLMHQAKNC